MSKVQFSRSRTKTGILMQGVYREKTFRKMEARKAGLARTKDRGGIHQRPASAWSHRVLECGLLSGLVTLGPFCHPLAPKEAPPGWRGACDLPTKMAPEAQGNASGEKSSSESWQSTTTACVIVYSPTQGYRVGHQWCPQEMGTGT